MDQFNELLHRDFCVLHVPHIRSDFIALTELSEMHNCEAYSHTILWTDPFLLLFYINRFRAMFPNTATLRTFHLSAIQTVDAPILRYRTNVCRNLRNM
jgi:hypothetical protein